MSRLGSLENNGVFSKHHKASSKEFLTRYFLASVSLRVREMMLVIGGRLWDGIEGNPAAAPNKARCGVSRLESRVFLHTRRRFAPKPFLSGGIFLKKVKLRPTVTSFFSDSLHRILSDC